MGSIRSDWLGSTFGLASEMSVLYFSFSYIFTAFLVSVCFLGRSRGTRAMKSASAKAQKARSLCMEEVRCCEVYLLNFYLCFMPYLGSGKRSFFISQPASNCRLQR